MAGQEIPVIFVLPGNVVALLECRPDFRDGTEPPPSSNSETAGVG